MITQPSMKDKDRQIAPPSGDIQLPTKLVTASPDEAQVEKLTQTIGELTKDNKEATMQLKLVLKENEQLKGKKAELEEELDRRSPVDEEEFKELQAEVFTLRSQAQQRGPRASPGTAGFRCGFSNSV